MIDEEKYCLKGELIRFFTSRDLSGGIKTTKAAP
jgi:hypothetical protein